MWEPRCLTALWAFTACYMDSFTFLPRTCNMQIDCLKYYHNYILCIWSSLLFIHILRRVTAQNVSYTDKFNDFCLFRFDFSRNMLKAQFSGYPEWLFHSLSRFLQTSGMMVFQIPDTDQLLLLPFMPYAHSSWNSNRLSTKLISLHLEQFQAYFVNSRVFKHPVACNVYI
jgi:hypothetical protein